MRVADKIEFVSENLSLEARLLQLAEEASELAQAATKCVRKISKENPTPKPLSELEMNLVEEAVDVLVSMKSIIEIGSIFDFDPYSDFSDMVGQKAERWYRRLKSKEEGDEDVTILRVDGDPYLVSSNFNE